MQSSSSPTPSLVVPPTSPNMILPMSNPVPLRRSHGISKAPLWHVDYVTKKAAHVTYPISAYLSYENISPSHQVFLRSLSHMHEPRSYAEAIKDTRWVEAMASELEALKLNHTWDLVSLPHGKLAIGCRWVYKVKLKASGEVERIKARLVAKGYNQQEGLDYHETFSPVVKIATVRIVLSLAAQHNWHIHQLDVYNAFLQGDLDDEVYMQLPQGLSRQGECGGGNIVCRLVKSLYGLKQASRQWNMKLSEALIQSGFIQSSMDHSLFIRKKGNDIVIILVYVDDMLVTGSSISAIEETKASLHAAFKIKDLGTLKFFLGVEFHRSSKGILINQRKYALEIISELGIGAVKPAWTPLEVNAKLTTLEFDSLVQREDDNMLEDKTKYQRLIGKMLYLTLTRPDISYAVQTLSQFLQQPKQSHWDAAVRVMKYIKREPALGVLLSNKVSIY